METDPPGLPGSAHGEICHFRRDDLSAGATKPEPQGSAPAELGLGPDDIGRIMERLGEGAILVDLATRAVLKANDPFYKLSHFEPAEGTNRFMMAE